MRASFPVNPRRVRRSSPSQLQRHHATPLSPTALQTLRQFDTGEGETKAVKLARLGAPEVQVHHTKHAEGNGTPVAVSNGGRPHVLSLLHEATTAAAAAAEVAEVTQGLAPSTAASSQWDARLARVRSLLRQVELPVLDTLLIEVYVLHLRDASPQRLTLPRTPTHLFTRNGGEEARERLQDGHSRPASASSALVTHVSATSTSCAAASAHQEPPTTVHPSSGEEEEEEQAPKRISSPMSASLPDRSTLADLHVNSASHAKQSSVNGNHHNADENTRGRSGGVASHTFDTESPFLSLKLLRGSKHACYYVPEEPARVDVHATAYNEELKEEEKETGSEEWESSTPAFLTQGPMAVMKRMPTPSGSAEANIVDTAAVLEDGSGEAAPQLSCAPQQPQQQPQQRNGAPSRIFVPPQCGNGVNVNGSSNSMVLPLPKNSSSSSAAVLTAAAAARPLSSSSSFEMLLARTEETLVRYRASLAAALRAVQHREAVWTALQHFLHVVRKDWERKSTRAAAAEAALRRCRDAAAESCENAGGDAVLPMENHRPSLSQSRSGASFSVMSSPASDMVETCEETEGKGHANAATPTTSKSSPLSEPPMPQHRAKKGTDIATTLQEADASHVPSEKDDFLSNQPSAAPLRDALRLSLDQILSQPSNPPPSAVSSGATGNPLTYAAHRDNSPPTPSSSAGLTSPQLPHTQRPPLLTPSLTTLHRLSVPAAHDAPSCSSRKALSSTPHGSLPSMEQRGNKSGLRSGSDGGAVAAAATQSKARLLLRRAPSLAAPPRITTTTPVSARATSALQRSQSAPRVPPAALLSPRPPSGRASAVTPRARIVPNGSSASTSTYINDIHHTNGGGKSNGSRRSSTGAALARQPCAPSLPRRAASAFARRLTTPTGATTTTTTINRHGSSSSNHQDAHGHSPLFQTASSAIAHDGVVSLSTPLHAVPRRVYTNCLYHYLYYLQRTTLAVLEAVETLRRQHLTHPAPFIIEHRNYLLEILSQTSTLARDAVVQWLLHDTDAEEGATLSSAAAAATPRLHHSPHYPLTSSSNSSVGSDPGHTRLRPHHAPVNTAAGGTAAAPSSPYSARHSLSNPTQEAEQAEERAVHRAVQVAAVRGRWPEQLLRHPLLSSHASLSPFGQTPPFLMRLSSRTEGLASRTLSDHENERNRTADPSQGDEGEGTAHLCAELLRLPEQVLALYGGGGDGMSSAEDPPRAEGFFAFLTPRGSDNTAAAAAADAVQETTRDNRWADRPSSGAVVSLKPLAPALQKRLETGECMLHREVAVTLAYVQLCMECALRREYPLYLRGIVAVHAQYVSTAARASLAHTPRSRGYAKTPSSPWLLRDSPYSSQPAASDAAKRVTVKRTVHEGTLSHYDRVMFDDESLRTSWMEELKVSWQLLMSGSSDIE